MKTYPIYNLFESTYGNNLCHAAQQLSCQFASPKNERRQVAGELFLLNTQDKTEFYLYEISC